MSFEPIEMHASTGYQLTPSIIL